MTTSQSPTDISRSSETHGPEFSPPGLPSSFLLNNTLSCYTTTKLYAFTPVLSHLYQQGLSDYLTSHLEKFDLATWKNCQTHAFVEVQCDTVIHQICLYYLSTTSELPSSSSASPSSSCLIIYDAHAAVIHCLNTWISMSFDCVVSEFPLSTRFLIDQFQFYVDWYKAEMQGADKNTDANPSEGIFLLEFSTPKSAAPMLKKITMAITQSDLDAFVSRSQSRSRSHATDDYVLTHVFRHLNKTSGIDFASLEMTRINCQDMSLTSKGIVKIRPEFGTDNAMSLITRIVGHCRNARRTNQHI